MSLTSPSSVGSKNYADGRFAVDVATPSKVKMTTAQSKTHGSIPIAPKWTLSRPYLTMSHHFEPRGAFDGDETQPKPACRSFSA